VVSGQPFTDYMDQHVLEPLGMHSSSFQLREDIARRLAAGYLGDEEGKQLPRRHVPSAGLHSSVLDLGRFLQMTFGGGELAGRRILEPGSVALMLRPQNEGVPLDLDFRVGLGWALGPDPFLDRELVGVREVVAGHRGSSLLFRSRILRVALRLSDDFLLLDVSIPGADMAATELSLVVSPIDDETALLKGSGGLLPHIDGTIHAAGAEGEERLQFSGFELRRRTAARSAERAAPSDARGRPNHFCR
jgi:hypothetical protein